MSISKLIGLTLTRVDVADEVITFTSNDGRVFKMLHHQDCCECVRVEDVIGDVLDLIDTPIVYAEERSNSDESASESGTWTFYELRTIKGSVTIRWYGSSNGYYSEDVDFEEIQ
jgi:hypothetical protein